MYNNEIFANYIDILRNKYLLNNSLLLVQTPQFLFESLNIKVIKNQGYYAYPPTGLQWIARSLSNMDLKIDIVDLNYEILKNIIYDNSFSYNNWLEILDGYIKQYNPSIIGVSDTSIYCDVTQSTFPLTGLLEHLHKSDRHIIITGGPTPTNEFSYYLQKNLCHFVVTGEGENKVKFLFDYLFKCKLMEAPVSGIYFKPDKNIEQTKGVIDRVNLKGNLIGTYDNIPISDYKDVGSLNPYSRMSGIKKPFSVFQLNRGCRANCKFCGVTAFMGKGLRQYPVKDVLDEMDYLVKEKDIRHFELLDDDFLATGMLKEGVKELLTGMVKLKEDFNISWSANNGLIATAITEDLLCLIRDSGCIGFKIGVESGNKEILKKIRKPGNLETLRKVGRMLQKFPELFVGGSYIIGLFGTETFGQILDTFKFSNEMNLDWSNFTVFQFTSKARAEAEKFQIIEKGATDFIPAKDSSSRELSSMEGLLSGSDIFKLSEDIVPSREQIKQIWFTFNIIANYINNKHLKEGGRPENFISWLEAVQISYPENPYMKLFTSLGYVLIGNIKKAKAYLKQTKSIVSISEYWDYRFKQFDLHSLMNSFPLKDKEVYEKLNNILCKYRTYM